MRRSKADVDRYVSSVQGASPSPKEKPVKGFLFAKLYFEAKEYELAKRYVSAYLTVQERDPKAHKFLGQLYEREGNIDKAVGCYKRSVDLNPAQKDLVLKVAELLCGKPDRDSRAEFWLEKAAKLLPGSPAVYNLKEKLLSSQGQQGWNQLFDLLQSELQLRPDNPHINIRLVCLYRSDGRLEEAVNHCLAVEKKGTLRCSLDWYSTVARTLQDFLTLPNVLSNEKVRRKLQKELLLAQCSLLRLSLAEKSVSQCVEALHSFDNTMQETTKLVCGTADELSEAFTEMKGHLYLHAGTLLLKMAHVKEQQWREVTDLAALCYLLAYRVPKPKGRPSKGERGPPAAMESLACDRLSQSGHMLLNLSQENDYFVKEVVEAFGNRSGQGSLFEMLFGTEAPAGPSFIGNDDIRSIGAEAPDVADLAKSDAGAIPQHSGDLQQLVWLGLQWALMGQRAALRDWLMKLFPRLTLETSKLDTNTPESICLLDLEVFLCGVVFCSQTQLQETQKISASSQLHEVRCLPLPLVKLLSNERQRDWWSAVYSLLHNKALPGTSAKLRMTVQHGLGTLRAGEKHGLQPALVIHWARHLRETGSGFDSYYDQKEYIGRSVHYWKVVLPLLEKIKKRRSIPEPLDPLFMHFASKDLQISEVKGLEEEVKIAFAALLDIEGKTEEAIATLENINSISASWHLAQIFQRLSEQAGNGVEENQDRCVTFLKKFRKYLSIIYTANAAETDKLPVSMEEVMDLLNDVNQQLGESGRDMDEEEEGQSAHSSPNQLADPGAPTSRIKFSTPSPTKNALSPSKRHIFSPPHWAEDQKSILQMLCQQVEALTNEVHDLRHNSSGATASPHHRMYDQGYGAEGLQEPFPAAQSFHGAPLTVATTGPSGPVYYNPSPAYNSQYLLRTTANVTPTKAPVYGMNRLPPQQHMYAYQQPTHTPPLQTNPGCMYPQDPVYGAPLRFESPATMLSPYSEEYYNHGVPQPSTNPPLPEPGYFTKPAAVPVQPPKGNEAKPMEFGKIGFGQQIPVEPPKVPTFGAGVVAQSTPAAASFKFNSNFKSNDGDFTFPSMQIKNSESLLGLLTSDLPPRNEQPIGQTAATQDQGPVSQTGIFNFGVEKAAGFSFADAAQSQSKTGLFGNTDQPFSFTDVTKPVFGAPSAEEHEKPESDGEGARVDEDEDGPHFEPIVPLPDKVDVKTGEEEEEEMFCNRAKLFRFDSETREWKERGIGSIKILRHKTSGKAPISPGCGCAIDYADEMPKPEQLAIRFKTTDEAALFKAKFEEAQKVVPKSPQKQEEPVEKEVPPKESSPQMASKDLDFGALFAKKEGLAAVFGKKGGQWDCGACLVRNDASASACVSCQTPKPNANVASTSPVKAPAPPSSAFTFSIGSQKASDAPATTGFKANFNIGTAFKFGQGEDKGSPASFKFELPHSQAESKPSSSKGFSFSMPIPAGPFKFGTKEPVKLAAPAEVSSDAGPASICLKNMAEQHREREEKEVVNAGPSQEGTEQEENLLFSGKQNTFTFADLAKSSQGNFQFGQKDPNFSGFSGAGEQLFASLKPSEKQDSAQEQDEEDMYKTEEHDDIQFDPVVQMPEKVDLVTGEEDEEVLYSHRVKLFRFDADTSQWKERGVGNLKILKNNKNGKLRVLMRREQVFKVCANHLITTTMNLKPLSGSDRAWMWLANDFSEGDANLEQLAAKFKTPEMAEEFKQKFEECQRLLLDIPLQTPHKLVDTGRTAHLIQKAEEMKTGLKDLKSFLTDDKAKIKEQGSQVDDTAPNRTLASMNKPHSEACMSLEWDNYDLQEDALDKTADTSLCAFPLAASPEVRKNLFRFGESTAGFSFSFQPIISPSKSPAKLNQSRASVGTDDESETQEEERDGQYFEPVVPLPDLVEISTGEENELIVFCHRAKLYRYDKELSQWKERGIGDIKILQNKDTKRVRLVMRRDQVLKLCANHWITSTMKLEPMKGAEKAWIWSALDFSEGEGKVEQLAVRFKLLEVAIAFKDVFEAAKNAQEGNTELTPVSTKEFTPRKTTCGLAALAALEETTRERTELPQSSNDTDSSTSPAAVHGQQTPSKTIVSPPKFVFGSDSVQKIFGSPPSSSELMPSIKTSSKDKAASAASPSFKVPESASAVRPSSATLTPSMPTFKVPTRVQEKAGVGAKTDGVVEPGDSKDLQIVFVREPTAEQEAFARSLLLPRTFFCYQNEPGYVSDDSMDDEDYEAAVRKLNGKLYPDPPEAITLETGAPETVTRETVVHAAAPVDPPAGERDAECVIVWEKKPTPEEQERAARLQLPPTFFCGVGSDEGEKDKPEDFETELRKAQEDLAQQKRTEGSEVADPVVSSSSDAPAAEKQASPQPDSSSEATPAPSCPAQDSAPIDLSTKKGPETEPDSSSQEPTTAFAGFGGFGSLGSLSSLGGFSFADLAKNTSDFAFGKQDANFTWANAGATVFGVAPTTQTEADQPGSDEEEAASSADIHFEPIVSLPEVETKSGEEDEEILFKERAKLFRWDRSVNQWKERGVGDIKILYHPQKRCYRVLMRRDQVLKVCANHTITQGMELVPMNTSNNALVWNATDYAEGSAQIEQLAAKFKTAELADSFRKTFEECLSRLSQADCGQMSRALEHSREGNPTVFFCVSADGEPLGKITMELFSHIVPKTAENFRALCTGERGFGFRNSVFHRIIPDFMCQGGDFTNQDGTGGKSIYGEKFEDENFDVRHTGPGLLSMANRGRDTNNSQFFITLKKGEHLDFKHVAFGFVKDGMDVVRQMGELGTKSGKPSKKIVITDCGQLQ
ncbi:hypothetical protein GJAV_G00206370 [Gymnothorax javanicus]|nr:hypothetical protein GJAV_G00206370 [Gymnothorax javanicus]